MKAAVLFAQNDLRVTEWPEPELLPGCVKVRVHRCGICGSDVPRVLGDAAHSYPIILGHEFSGEIVAIGEGVTKRAVGDRVAGVPLIPRMDDENSLCGHYAQSAGYSFVGSRQDGAFAEYVVVPEANVVPFGPEVSYDMGALFEPATVALHGLFEAGFSGGHDVAVMGAGNIGILAIQWARILGARRIAAFDVAPERLAIAKALGADMTFDSKAPDCAKHAVDYAGNKGFPFVFDTAGLPETIALGFSITGVKGHLTCIGTPTRPVTLPWEIWERMNRNEFSVRGTWMSYSAPFPGREWELTARAFASGQLRLDDSMIFRTVPLDAIAEAFSLYQSPGAVKGKMIVAI